MQQDGWKLQVQEQSGKIWLYNLTVDPTEQDNLSDVRPERLAELTKLLYSLDEEMIEPLWPTLAEAEIAVDYTIDKRPDSDHATVIWAN